MWSLSWPLDWDVLKFYSIFLGLRFLLNKIRILEQMIFDVPPSYNLWDFINTATPCEN